MKRSVRKGGRTNSIRLDVSVSVLMFVGALAPARAGDSARISQPIGVVLREPLPAEELALSSNAREWVIKGPTFTYRVQKSSAAISALRVLREDQDVITSSSPLEIRIDQYRLASDLVLSEVAEIAEGKDKIVLRAKGVLRDPAPRRPVVDCSLVHTFFNDGVVVTAVKLTPRKDLPVEKALVVECQGQGQFSHYLHKRRDEHGESAVRGALPVAGQTVRLTTLTSCLQVFSPSAVLALFTDCGATHLSRTNLDTAAVDMISNDNQRPRLSLSQYLVHVAPGDNPYVLKAGEEFSFRVGLSIGPNRIAPPRTHDLRMFAWIGDAKYPYPTDPEIEQVARAGYTVFQMHRLGTPGEPRPPANELERVIKKVHDLGMLFLWTENADLMFANAPGVQDLKAKGEWRKWQGFWPDGGRYTATMDPYCDLLSTCLASPNGLADYRLATIRRMMQRFQVDGIYLDDNLAYPGCQLWREHGHPKPVYDCLIELHEMNWKRRQLLRSKCPHQVLATHNTKAIIQPVICDFDAVLYGEGYSFGSLQNYWDYYQGVKAMPAQGMIWPGGVDPARCAASVAYNYDLLTGGGQYCYIDWRLFPKKFSYGAGVTDDEHLYVQTYNLTQYYFGLYESKPRYFADSTKLFSTSTPQTYATIYRNQIWGDWLLVVANMSQEFQKTSLQMPSLQNLGFDPKRTYVLFDTHLRTTRRVKGQGLNQALKDISIPGQGLQLYCVRELPFEGAYHVWGGKRITEVWDCQKQKLTLTIQGPAGLEDTLFLGCVGQRVKQVQVCGKNQEFSFDPVQNLIHGKVTFASEPLKVEVLCSTNTVNTIAESPVTPDALGHLFGAH